RERELAALNATITNLKANIRTALGEAHQPANNDFDTYLASIQRKSTALQGEIDGPGDLNAIRATLLQQKTAEITLFNALQNGIENDMERALSPDTDNVNEEAIRTARQALETKRAANIESLRTLETTRLPEKAQAIETRAEAMQNANQALENRRRELLEAQ